MSEFKQQYLGKYLGLWKYELGGNIKYYSVKPTGNSFTIRWGNSIDGLAGEHYISVEDSAEVYQRVLSKARGGFKHIDPIPWEMASDKCYDQFNNIDEVLESEQAEARKRKPRKRKLSLLDWVGGLDEYRDNDQP